MARTLTSERLAQPARRVDVRVLAGLVLLLVTLAGGYLFWQSRDETQTVLVYARDVPAGAAIRSEDLATVSFVVPSALSSVVVPASARDRLVGRVAAEKLHAGGLVQEAALTGRPAVPPGGGVVALPVSATSAAGGRIGIGDHVRVIATWNRTRDDAKTQTILADAVVEDVGRAPTSELGAAAAGGAGNGPIAFVSVVVNDPTEMEQVVAAKENAALDLVWLAPSVGER